MKAQVIFYSALAFLTELAASIPYAADFQRYSNTYQNNPSLEAHHEPNQRYQNVDQHPYDAPQFQEQEARRLSQDNYYARNQNRYSNVGPPPQVKNEPYSNYHGLPNQYYADNYAQPIQRVPQPEVLATEKQYHSYPQPPIQHTGFPANARDHVVETSHPVYNDFPLQVPTEKGNTNYVSLKDILPQLLIDQAFAPSIPAVPPRNVYSSQDALKRVNDHYVQVEPVEVHGIPVVQPAPPTVEQGTPLSASERNAAYAGNPVETVPHPQVQPRPNVLSDQRIQSILAANPHKSRFIVIYPNGKVEHVANLETVSKQYPNYHLVNAGNIHPNAGQNGAVITPPVNVQPTTVTKKTLPTLTHEPSDFEVDVIVTKPSQKPANPVPPTLTTAPILPNSAPATTTPTSATSPITAAPQAVATTTGPNSSVKASVNQAPSTDSTSPATVVAKPHTPQILPVKPTPQTLQQKPTNIAVVSNVHPTPGLPPANPTIPAPVAAYPQSPQTLPTKPTPPVGANAHTTPEVVTKPTPQTTPVHSEATANASNQTGSATSSAHAESTVPVSVVANPQTPQTHPAKPTPPVVANTPTPPAAVTKPIVPATAVHSDGTAVTSNQAGTQPTSAHAESHAPQTLPTKPTAPVPAAHTEATSVASTQVENPLSSAHAESTNPTPIVTNQHIPQTVSTKPSPPAIANTSDSTSLVPNPTAQTPPAHTEATAIASNQAGSPNSSAHALATNSAPAVANPQTLPVAVESQPTNVTNPPCCKQTVKPSLPSPPPHQTTSSTPVVASPPPPQTLPTKPTPPSPVVHSEATAVASNQAGSPTSSAHAESSSSAPVVATPHPLQTLPSKPIPPPVDNEPTSSVPVDSKPTNGIGPPCCKPTVKPGGPAPIPSTPVEGSLASPPTTSPEPVQTPVTVLEPHSQPKNTHKTPVVVPVLCDSPGAPPKSIDEFVVNEASNKVVPKPSEEVPDLGDSDVLANNPNKPVVWFRTSDPNFWAKLSPKNNDLDVVYFFQIHNQPKVVVDTKRTMFPNGTIFEEYTETTTDFEGDVPKVKRTTKLINPKE